jgi:hypothetical protein
MHPASIQENHNLLDVLKRTPVIELASKPARLRFVSSTAFIDRQSEIH